METSILLVDRDSILIAPLRREFGERRLLLRIAMSVGQARQLLQDFAPNVVIIDADMPDVVDFVTELRAIDDPISLIGLTDSGETRTQLQAMGIETIVLKREGPQPVVEAVRQYADPDAPTPASDK